MITENTRLLSSTVESARDSKSGIGCSKGGSTTLAVPAAAGPFQTRLGQFQVCGFSFSVGALGCLFPSHVHVSNSPPDPRSRPHILDLCRGLSRGLPFCVLARSGNEGKDAGADRVRVCRNGAKAEERPYLNVNCSSPFVALSPPAFQQRRPALGKHARSCRLHLHRKVTWISITGYSSSTGSWATRASTDSRAGSAEVEDR